MGFAEDERDAEGFEVHRDQGGGGQVGSDGHHSTVKILHAEFPEHIQVPGVGGDGLGHPIGDLVNDVLIGIDGEHILPEAVKLQGHL